MMIPSLETYKRMVGAHAGLWPELVNDGDDIEFAVKLGTDLAKAILKGAPVTLVTAVVAVSRHSVRIVGLRIEDDTADPAFLQHPQEQPREQELFVKLLAKKSAWLTFFDELVRPIMTARVAWNEADAASAIKELQRTAPHYQTSSEPILTEALDKVLIDFGRWHRNGGKPDSLVWSTIPLTFEKLQPLNVSSPEAGSFSLDDADEGGVLEKSLFHLLESNFPVAVHLNPQFDDGAVRREFADLLIVTDSTMFIVQSKVMAMLERNPNQTSGRRVSNVFYNFQKAVGQLGGSVRMLRQGKTIYTKQGLPIAVNNLETKIVHGIVLLSTTNLPLPWNDIASQLVAASKKAQAQFHVLDLIEFQQHVAFGKDLDRLGVYLKRRFEIIEGTGNACLKTRFINEEIKPVLSDPIDDEEAGYVFVLEVQREHQIDFKNILGAFLNGLKIRKHSGRCEYFQDIGLLGGEKYCWIALGLRRNDSAEAYPSYDWWLEFKELIRPDLEAGGDLEISPLSEMATMDAIRASHPLAIIMELMNGKTVRFTDPDAPQRRLTIYE
jgi:hypothetical protein